MGFTKQLNQFEPLRLDFDVETDVFENENTSQAVDRVYDLLEDKMVEKLDSLLKEVKLVVNGDA